MFFNWYKTLVREQKIGLIFLAFGIFFFTLFILYKRSNHLYFSKTPQTSIEIPNEILPRRIVILSVGLDLPVSPASDASYLLGSGVLGKPGNIVIYGHNKKKIFGPILSLKIGAEIKIEDEKGNIYKYEVRETKVVLPKNIEVLNPTQDETLTLYTCTGNFDLKRFVVIAKKI